MKNFMSYGDAESLFTEIKEQKDIRPSAFLGTVAEWNALSTEQKAKYKIINFSDGTADGNSVVVDSVENGNLNPVTSNAVYQMLHRYDDTDWVTYQSYDSYALTHLTTNFYSEEAFGHIFQDSCNVKFKRVGMFVYMSTNIYFANDKDSILQYYSIDYINFFHMLNTDPNFVKYAPATDYILFDMSALNPDRPNGDPPLLVEYHITVNPTEFIISPYIRGNLQTYINDITNIEVTINSTEVCYLAANI